MTPFESAPKKKESTQFSLTKQNQGKQETMKKLILSVFNSDRPKPGKRRTMKRLILPLLAVALLLETAPLSAMAADAVATPLAPARLPPLRRHQP